jgi:hypothetical protein
MKSTQMATAKAQDTGKFRTNTKDQFYTKEAVAKGCIAQLLSLLPHVTTYLWVEPSAGNGAFLNNFPASCEKIGLDIEPKGVGILQQDFLKWNPPADKQILVIGNPPFGRQSSMAKTFISKSCEFAQAIAFILPKSFTKPSMYNAFPLKFHLIHTAELEKDSFILNGTPYDVPCVFQVWEKKGVDRVVENKILPSGFQYVKGSDTYDAAFRRVGGLAGKCYRAGSGQFSIQSHYFLKFDVGLTQHIDEILEKINSHVFPSNTVGPRSLSKSEANAVINTLLSEFITNV